MYFQRHIEETTEVWRLDLVTNESFKMASLKGRVDVQEIERDESRLIIATFDYGGGLGISKETAIVDLRSGSVRHGTVGAGACFVRDGAVVFCHQDSGELWIDERDGQKRKLRNSGALPQSDTAGSRVLYVSDLTVPYNKREWYVLDLDTNTTEAVGVWESPVLSSDGKSIVGLGAALDGSVWQYDVKGHSKALVARLSSQVYGFRSSPGGIAGISDVGGVLTVIGGKVKQLPR